MGVMTMSEIYGTEKRFIKCQCHCEVKVNLRSGSGKKSMVKMRLW